MGLPGSGVALLVLLGLCAAVLCSTPPPPEMLHESFAGKSEFRTVNRKMLGSCLNPSPYLSISVSTGDAPLPDEAFVQITVAGVLRPSDDDWVAMITPSNSSVSGCPFGGVNYVQTGDLAHLPLLCHYPVKAQYLTRDPGYLGCKNATCQKKKRGASRGCRVRTCAATLTFHVVNFRTDVEFVLFSGGFRTPCLLKRSGVLRFANPASPLYGHLSSTDSTATSMRLTWVSGDGRPQQVQYGAGKFVASQVSTFTQKDMCGIPGLPSPAKDFGWHDPGYIHSAVMTGLQPSQSYTYRYGRDYAESGSVYVTLDSGGECGVAYESYFRMPAVTKDNPWYSIEQGSVHFTVMSTEHDWSEKSEQYKWMNQDLSSVNRSRTPWVVFIGTCAVYQGNCNGMPTKDANGIDVYDSSNYTAPIHAIVGAGGFSLDNFPKIVLHKWSSSRVSEFGYARVHATRDDILVQFVNSSTMEIRDQFRIVKRAPARKL
nr:unnamed protein product [Digitaria exilis]